MVASERRVSRVELRFAGILERLVIRLLERLDLGHPPPGDKCGMDGMVVVDVVRGTVGELHRQAEIEVVLVVHLFETLEVLDTRDIPEAHGISQESCFFSRPGRMAETEGDGVPDHGDEASADLAPDAKSEKNALKVVTIGQRVLEI